jgi:Flp pilus assembly protein TadG
MTTTTRTRTRIRPRGVIAVECAMVLPLLLTILLGVWDIGRLVDASQILNNAAREGGRQASTGQAAVTDIQNAILNTLSQAGVSTTGVTISVTNLTNASRSDPTTANQLDQFQVAVTLPSSNVRYISLNNLIGSNTLRAVSVWNSMRDIPLTVSTTIPIN